MKKKALALVLILTLLLTALITVLFVTISADAPEGDPVSSVEDFEAMTPTGKYYLTNDIDFGGKVYDEGCIIAAFSGTLDGCGYSVHNYTLTSEGSGTSVTVGTFRLTNGVANMTLKNITFGNEDNPIKVEIFNRTNVGVVAGAGTSNSFKSICNNVTVYADMVVDSNKTAERIAGGFIGLAGNTTMTDCKTYGTVTIGNESVADAQPLTAGGFFGRTYASRTIELTNCENYADVSAYCSTNSARVGGFIANSVSKPVTLTNCTNYGNITAYDTDDTPSISYVGGIIAMANDSSTNSINECINRGTITGTNVVGGILGKAGGPNSGTASLDRCINYGKYTLDAAYADPFCGTVRAETSLTVTDCVDRSNDVETTAGEQTLPPLVTEPVTTPAATTPAATTPAETTPVQTTPVETTPVETTPVETTPVETTPVETTPEETTPDATTPNETTPDDTTPPPAESGCGSALSFGLLTSLIPAALVIGKKKR